MVNRELGRTGLGVSPIGFGAFKIGRNEGIKYPRDYDLPDDETASLLLNGVFDLGITYIDTAPAYGSSEQRIGKAIAHRRRELVISTKVGETFESGRSTFDFSAAGVRDSVQRSLQRLRTNVIDLVFAHSNGRDLAVLEDTDVVATLHALRDEGLVRAIGFSGKTVGGAAAALDWADAIMVEYHLENRAHEPVIAQAAAAGVGVVVKKGLASGHLSAGDAIRFVLANPGVSSMLVGSLSLEHLEENVRVAQEVGTEARRHEGRK